MRYLFVLATAAVASFGLPLLSRAAPIPRADAILPQTTAFHVSIGSLPSLSKKWRKTQLGQLAREPQFRDFANDLADQFANNVSLLPRVGLTWSTLQQKSFQQVDWAIVQPEGDPLQVAVVLIADSGGDAGASHGFIRELVVTLGSRGVAIIPGEAEGHDIYEVQWPSTERYEPGRQAYFVVFPNSQIIASDNELVLQEMLSHIRGGRDRLQDLDCYRRVLVTAGEASRETPDLTWFARPFAFAEAIRAANGGRKKRSRDLLKVLPRQGFDAIQAVGGIAFFDYEKFDSLHHLFVYAPSAAGKSPSMGGERFDLAARMLSFINASEHVPPPWVSDNAITFVSFRAKLRAAFEHSKSLFNDMAAAEVFEDVLRAIEQDPAGPQVNLRNGLVDHLGTRVNLLTSSSERSSEPAGRLGVAIELTDSAAVSKTIDKMMASEANATRTDYKRVTFWEVIDVSTAPPSEDGFADFGFDDPDFDDGEQEAKLFPKKVLFVSKGHLFVTTSTEFAKQLVDATSQTLADSELYKTLDATLLELEAGDDSLRAFTNTGRAYEAVYEGLRAAEDVDPFADFGLLMDKLLLDGSDLPPFAEVRTRFSASGMYVRSQENGWKIVGCTLKADQNQ